MSSGTGANEKKRGEKSAPGPAIDIAVRTRGSRSSGWNATSAGEPAERESDRRDPLGIDRRRERKPGSPREQRVDQEADVAWLTLDASASVAPPGAFQFESGNSTDATA